MRESLFRPAIIAGFLTAFLPGFEARAGPLVRGWRWSREPFSRVVAPPGARRDLVLVLDREEYDPLDLTGVLVIRFDPGKRELGDLRTVAQRDGEGAVHVRTRDGRRIIAHRGADGHAVGGDGAIDAAVEPLTFYYLAISGGPTVVPEGHPLILARTVEAWFDPAAR